MSPTATPLEREILAKLFKGDATGRQLARRLAKRFRRFDVEETCESLMRRGLIASLGQATSATRNRPSSWWTIADRPQAFKLIMSLGPLDFELVLDPPAIVAPGPRSRLSPLATRQALPV